MRLLALCIPIPRLALTTALAALLTLLVWGGGAQAHTSGETGSHEQTPAAAVAPGLADRDAPASTRGHSPSDAHCHPDLDCSPLIVLADAARVSSPVAAFRTEAADAALRRVSIPVPHDPPPSRLPAQI